jgi:hypothetical protein
MKVSANSFSSVRESTSELSENIMIGASAALALLYEGGLIPCGSWRSVLEIADCTSAAALSISRSSANWIVTLVFPCELDDVMLSIPEIVANCCSSGVATDVAITSGLAPGSPAETVIVG